ncbi:MAG: hypothetical protein EXS55_02850 [Candidatus Magasanikbacteria bacterium]|nr:hypothetical protein [Candidatus Magasanikbacteria bacterium]
MRLLWWTLAPLARRTGRGLGSGLERGSGVLAELVGLGRARIRLGRGLGVISPQDDRGLNRLASAGEFHHDGVATGAVSGRLITVILGHGFSLKMRPWSRWQID